MAILDKKKLGALVDKNAKKGPPPKKPGGGGAPPFPPKGGDQKPPKKPEDDDAPEDQHGDDAPDEHDENDDKQIATEQAARIANGNGDDELAHYAGDLEVSDDGEALAPEWATDMDVWERAEKAVSGLPDVQDEDKGLLLVHVYQALGGEIDGADDEGGDEDGDEGEGGGDDDEDADELPDDAGDY